MISFRAILAGCWFSHATHWQRVIVNGVWMKACDRCQTPYAAILAHRGEREDITASTVPAILVRHAKPEQKVKPKRQRKPRAPKVASFPKRAS